MSNIKRNAEHYYDPTAFEAILSIEQERKGKEKHMSMNAKLPRFYRGDIVITENNGKRGYGVIVSNNTVNYESLSVNILNITANAKDNVRYPAEIALSVPSFAICDRPWNVWKENIVEFVRECTAEEMAAIDKGLRSAFGLDEPKKKGIMEETAEILQKAAPIAQNEYIAKIEKENVDLKRIVEARKEDIETLQSQLEKAREDTDYWIEQATKAEETTPDIATLTAERNAYKAMYEKLLDKLIGA